MFKSLRNAPQERLFQLKSATKRWSRLLGAGLLLLAGQKAHAQTSNALSGTYTINSALPTSGTNFASFTSVASRLVADGVSGPVTITVSGGPYDEQFALGVVPGASATNTLTINGGGSTIKYSAASTTQRAVVLLNGADYVTLNNLTVDVTAGTYGYGILLTNSADNNNITNNTVNADITTTSANYAGIVLSGSATNVSSTGTVGNNNLIQGNTVNGGYYSITMFGNATTLSTGNQIRNNQVRDFYFYGIYFGYQDGAQIIGNEIARPLRTNGSTLYGIYATTTSRGLAIEKNRIHDLFTGNPTSTSSAYLIYLGTGTTATATAPNDIVNNVFYKLTGSGLQYCIYNASAAYTRIYNNTINSDDQTTTTTSTTYGIYSSGVGADVRNNVVNITRGGTGTKTGLYYVTNAPTSNYNDSYVPNGNVGYYTTTYTTLASWQAANGGAFDQNSLSADPIFTNPATGNLLPSNVLLNNAGTPLARVTDDITGAVRGAAPDLGAYEFTPVATDLTPLSLVGPATTSACYGTTEPLVVQVRNGGTSPLNFATNPATVTVVVTPPTGAAQTFTTTLSTGTLASGATQNITLTGTLNMAALGTYGFAVTATVTGDLNTGNDLLAPAPTRTVLAPVAGILAPGASSICVSGTASLTLTGAANGNLQYQSSTSATGTFTDIAGATSASYTTPVLTSTTYYRVRVGCNTNVVYSNISTITVNNPLVASTNSPQTVCSGNSATLTATPSAGSAVRFFTTATGGTALATTTAGSYTTPALTTNTTYYAEAYVGGQEAVGKPSTNGADGTNSAGGLYFTTTGPLTLSNVTVYQVANGGAISGTVYLIPGNPATVSVATAIASYPLSLPANSSAAVAPVVLPLNFAIPAAGAYTLYYAYTSSTSVYLVRDYTTAVPTTTYPYTSPSGLVSITGATLPSYYYYFYNWQISTECASATRTPIQVNLPVAASFPTATASTCSTTAYQLAGTVTGTATTGTYTTSGTGTFSPNATTLNASYTPSAADITAGSVTITLTSAASAPCPGATATLALSISRPAVATFSYPATGSNCAGSTGTISPTLATGATAGTFTSTSGLSVNSATGVIILANSIAGTYTVTNTAVNGSCAAVTATTTFTVNPTPARPTLTATYNGTVTTLTSSAATGNQFYFNGVAVPGATGQTYVINGSTSTYGAYTVVVTNGFGCSSLASVVTTVTTTRQGIAGASLLVYPNPTPTGQVTLELSGFRSATQLAVIDALGRVVRTETLPATAGTVTHSLDLSKVASGVYVLRLTNADGVETRRLVRE